MVHHNLVVKGPLFPLFPDGWTGPQALRLSSRRQRGAQRGRTLASWRHGEGSGG